MKNILILSTIMCFVSFVYGQTSNREMLQEVRREKLRIKSVQDFYNREQTQTDNSTSLVRKTRAGDTKISNVNSSSSEEGEAYICMDPNNNQRLAIGYMDNLSSGIVPIIYRIYYSNNAGTTWTKSNFNTATQFNSDFPGYTIAGGGDPVLEYDKNGVLHLTWIYLGVLVNGFNIDSTVAVMYHATSSNNGQSFNMPPGNDRFIAKCYVDYQTFESIPGSDGFSDRQWFAVDHSNGNYANSLYCSFIYFNSPQESPALTGGYVKRLANGNTAFGPRAQAFAGSVQFNNVRVDNNGTLHITGANIDNGEIVYAFSSDGGANFSAPFTIAGNHINLFGAQGSGYYHDRENSATNLAVDGKNGVHVVWSDFPANPGNAVRSFYSHKSKTATSFTAPLDLSTIFRPGYRVLMPTICAYQNRLSIGAYVVHPTTRFANYYVVHSGDNGANWGKPVLVSTDSFKFNSATNSQKWFGDYFNAVRNDTKVYNVWSDGRGTAGPKMYVGITEEWATSITEMTPVNSDITMGKIYPNPSTTEAYVDITSNIGAPTLSYKIIDLSGKEIIAKEVSLVAGKQKVRFDVQGLAKGMYTVHFTTSEGERFVRTLQCQ